MENIHGNIYGSWEYPEYQYGNIYENIDMGVLNYYTNHFHSTEIV